MVKLLGAEADISDKPEVCQHNRQGRRKRFGGTLQPTLTSLIQPILERTAASEVTKPRTLGSLFRCRYIYNEARGYTLSKAYNVSLYIGVNLKSLAASSSWNSMKHYRAVLG